MCKSRGKSTRLSKLSEKLLFELGVQAMKPKQRDAILTYMSGTDTLVVLPTGYGKSLIYAVLPLVYNKLRGKPFPGFFP